MLRLQDDTYMLGNVYNYIMCYLNPGVGYANYTELILTGDKMYQNYILWNTVTIISDLNKSIYYNHLN